MDWTANEVLCLKHKKRCMLKTGLKPTATYLKSFYICSEITDMCDFVQEAGNVSASKCLIHSGEYVELQAMHFSQTNKENRHFYRCPVGKNEKKSWCGFSVVKTPAERKTVSKLEQTGISKDINQDSMQNVVDKENKVGKEINQPSKPTLMANHLSSKAQNWNKAHLERKKTESEALRSTNMNDLVNDSLSYRDKSVMNVSDDEDDGSESSDSNSDDEVKIVTAPVESSSSDVVENATVPNATCRDFYNDFTSGVKISDLKNGGVKTNRPLLIEISDDDSEEEFKNKTDDVKSKKKSTPAESHVSQSQLSLTNRNQAQKTDSTTTQSQSNQLPSNQMIKNKSEIVKTQTQTSSTTHEIKSENSQPSTVIHLVKAPAVDLLKYSTRRLELQHRLNEKTKLMKTVDVNSLPDRGNKIREQIKDLSAEIDEIDKALKVMKVSDVKDTDVDSTRPISSVVSRPSSTATETNPTRVYTGQGIKYTEAQPLANYMAYHSEYGQRANLYGGRMTENRLQHVGQVTSEAIERLHSQFESCPSPEAEMEDPSGLKVPLMLHQRQALTWLTWRESVLPKGGILADDMGLGKTLTMISLILKQQQNSTVSKSSKDWFDKTKKVMKSEGTIIICPASLVHQWDKEIQKRVKSGLLKVILYHGPNRECSQTELANADVVLTTYNIVSREVAVSEEMKKNKYLQNMPCAEETTEDLEKDDSILMRIYWKRIIIDEGHSIKNHKSLTALSVCRLQSEIRWVLTGTPIHNDLLDIYSLLRFLRCSPFDEYKLWKRQVDNKSEKGTQRLNTLIKTLLLRRTKEQTCRKTGKPLVSLPPKKSMAHTLQLTPEERQVYEKIYNQSKKTMQEYLQQHEEKLLGKDSGSSGQKLVNPWSKDDHRSLAGQSASMDPGRGSYSASVGGATGGAASAVAGRSSGTQILLMLLRLRQCCSHLHLMKDAVDAEELQSEGLDLQLEEQMKALALADEKLADVESDASSCFNMSTPSTKIKTLLEMLVDVRQQNSGQNGKSKSVVVSQWTKMLEVVEYHLKKAGFRCCTIKGSVLPKQRSEMVETFNSDPHGPEVMLLSLRAGGVGLNLIGGNNLFLIDMHWNPALEQQACDRIYRVGQTKNVFIHRFVCKDTIEEKIVELQKHKMALAGNVLSGNHLSANKLSLADLRLLFGIETIDESKRFAASFQPTSSSQQSASSRSMHPHHPTPSFQPASTYQPSIRPYISQQK